MGGNAFSDVVYVAKDDVSNFKQQIIDDILSELGIVEFCFVGSSQNEDSDCGDIDLVVTMSSNKPALQKAELACISQSIFGFENVKIVGNAVCLKVVDKKTLKAHQVDIFPCSNVNDAKWLMNGLFRHLLLALVAKEESSYLSSNDFKTKITLSIPDGMQITINNSTTLLQRTTDPDIILSYLGFNPSLTPDKVLTLQSLAEEIANDRPEILQKYESYVSAFKNKKDYAISVQIVKEALMNAIVIKCGIKAS